MTSLVSVDSNTAKRSYAASAYLEPNLNRPNLLVLTEAYVTKVCFYRNFHICPTDTSVLTKVLFQDTKESLKRAVGVECIKDGIKLRVDTVQKDVIIAAG